RPGSSSSCGARRGRHVERQREREAGAGARPALHPQASAVMLDDLAADVQAEAATVRLVREAVARLMELVEDDVLVGRIDSRAIVAHVDPQRRPLTGELDLDAPFPRMTELRRV